MGACYNEQYFPGSLSETELEKAFADLQKSLTYDHGHDPYNGTFSTCSGLIVHSDPVDDAREASNWISDHAEKWEEAHAVKSGDNWIVGGWCAE